MMMDFGDFYAGRRVLVTGHSGFKGSWLLHRRDMLGTANLLEAVRALALNCDKAHQLLGWAPVWDFGETIARAVDWYRAWLAGRSDLAAMSRSQIADYVATAAQLRRALAGSDTAE